MLILANIQTNAFQSASGFCTTSDDFIDLTNQVIPRLLQRGDWPGTTMPVRVCVRDGCVTWPRYVGQVRKLHSCRGNIPVRSLWYEFLDYQGTRRLHEWGASQGRERQMINQFQSSVYNDIYGSNCYVRLYADLTADVGTTCTIYGTDTNNQPLQTLNIDGTNSMGLTITVQIQAGIGGQAYYGQTSIPIGRIDRVACEQTQGMKRLYAYDAVQDAMFDLAVYEPGETSPSYIRAQLDGERRGTQCACGQTPQTVIALVKLKFVPVVTPTDGLIFLDGAQGALLHGFRAVKREETGDLAGAKGYWAAAIEELNRQLEDFDPDGPVAENNVFAGRTFSNQQF